MIVRVEGPLGSGKATVVQMGLEAMGVEHRILQCDALDIMDVHRYLSGGEPVVVLMSVGRMRRDFREELMGRVLGDPDRTYWILEDSA